MNIYKNFLPKDIFKILKDNMMGEYFPWFFQNEVLVGDNKHFQFTYIFLNKKGMNCSPETMNIINPILKKIKYKKLNKVKANLLTRTNKITEQGMHIDQPQGTTGIFYINNCNGYTKFKTGEKIKSEENKYVEFNSTVEHTGSSCTNQNRRIVINFNYESD